MASESRSSATRWNARLATRCAVFGRTIHACAGFHQRAWPGPSTVIFRARSLRLTAFLLLRLPRRFSLDCPHQSIDTRDRPQDADIAQSPTRGRGIAHAYGGEIIWSAFATASVIFAIAVGYGVFTKSDLTSLGKILMIAVMGLFAVTLLYFVLSFFMNLTWLHLVISYIGRGIFVGLTAYDAQQIRYMSVQVSGDSVAGAKMSLLMALKMYINVVMIFWYLLQIFASGKR